MAQVANKTVENGSGAVVRADINSILAAVDSNNSGVSAPASPTPGMFWYDTGVSPATLKQRNAANTGWIPVSADTIGANTVRGNPTGSSAAEQQVTMAQLKTMLGWSGSLAPTSARVTTPQGFIIQGGRAVLNSTTAGIGSSAVIGGVLFPTVFPTACVSFVPAISGLGSTSSEHTETIIGVQTYDTAGGTLFQARLSGSNPGGELIGFTWLAVGY